MKAGPTRRLVTTLMGATLAGGLRPAFATPNAPRRTLFYKPAPPAGLWDTTVTYRAGSFYLFHPANGETWLATSEDGVSWKEHGPVFSQVSNSGIWTVTSPNGAEMHVKAYYAPPGNRMRFLQSSDLISWREAGDGREFVSDGRWYDTDESRSILWARWGDLWAIPRPGGGFHGYTVANAKDAIGLGFSESEDGIRWTVLPPALVRGTSLKPGRGGLSAPEVSAVREWDGKYYAVLGLDGLDPMFREFDVGKPDTRSFRPGHTIVVADSASGPFYPAAKNRRLLIGNNAYFLRLLDGPDGVLANHHCWEVDPSQNYSVTKGEVYLAPLKKVERDREGTLRLKWWPRNGRAKGAGLRIDLSTDAVQGAVRFIQTAPGEAPSLILEGELQLPEGAPDAPVGLYFEESPDTGTAFLVRPGGRVEYGRLAKRTLVFEMIGHADRELGLRGTVHFRLIRKGLMTEFYINDYLMQCYALPRSTGRMALVGAARTAESLAAWSLAD